MITDVTSSDWSKTPFTLKTEVYLAAREDSTFRGLIKIQRDNQACFSEWFFSSRDSLEMRSVCND